MTHSHTTDVLTEDDTSAFLESAIAEEGIEPDFVEVQSYEDDPFGGKSNLLLIAGKDINGETMKAQAVVNVSLENNPDVIRQEIALSARNLAEYFYDEMIDTVEVGGSRIKFCSAEGGWVECQECGHQVTLADTTMNAATFSADAEFSNPSPTPYDIQNFLRRLDSGETEVLKLYLLGALRRQCRCEFSLPAKESRLYRNCW